eukprot:3728717-Pleurochrysis_carterae.AAC.3
MVITKQSFKENCLSKQTSHEEIGPWMQGRKTLVLRFQQSAGTWGSKNENIRSKTIQLARPRSNKHLA